MFPRLWGLQADAVTVSPYMGRDAICPFLNHSDTACVFVECRPAGAKGLSGLRGHAFNKSTSLALYEHVASLCQQTAAATSAYRINTERIPRLEVLSTLSYVLLATPLVQSQLYHG